MRAGELPGDPEVEEAYSLADVFGWLRDCPQQTERAVNVGRSGSQFDRAPIMTV
jgi:hypothetical protein